MSWLYPNPGRVRAPSSSPAAIAGPTPAAATSCTCPCPERLTSPACAPPARRGAARRHLECGVATPSPPPESDYATVC